MTKIDKNHSANRVALIGVAHSTLLVGRALALAEIPVVGIYDPDPAKALQAALFLGISGQTDIHALLLAEPTILICTQAPPAQVPDSVELCLDLAHVLPTLSARDCRVEFAEPLPEQLPTAITSALPRLTLTLLGAPVAQSKAKQFLTGLSSDFETVLGT